MQYSMTQETVEDAASIEMLMEKAFGLGRQVRTVFRFRDGRVPLDAFGFVARLDGRMVASIRFWPVLLPGGATVPLLGPLAVEPRIRGLGIGRALVRKGLDATRGAGFPAVLVIGDPGYYAPFGFTVDPVHGLDMGGPLAPLTLMGIEFEEKALGGESGTIEPMPQPF